MRRSGAHAEQNEVRQDADGPAAARRETGAGAAVPPPLTADALRAAQGDAGNAAVNAMIARRVRPVTVEEQPDPGVHEVLRGSGKPLAAPVRQDMESRFGTDFSDVRLHTGAAAARSARAIGARAYTSGSHVVLGDGGGDSHTLAHELTHVVQQRQGSVAGTDNGAGLSVSDPSDRFEKEAEATAHRVMNSPAPAHDAHVHGSGDLGAARAVDDRAAAGGPAVQRAAVDVQRLELDIQGGGSEGPTTIRSASDLMVWLVGHPTRPAPLNWAEPAILQRVLAQLQRLDGPVGGDAVWGAVRSVVEARAAAQEASDSSSDSSSDSESGGGFFRPARARGDSSSESSSDEESDSTSVASSPSVTGEDWDEGQWDQDDIGLAQPHEFRREMSEEDRTRRQAEVAQSLSGYRLVGFHGTHVESIGSLIAHGPDAEKFGKGAGTGKGNGFYVAPVVAPAGKSASGSGAAKKEARQWGRFLVAVYVREDVEVVEAAGASDDGFAFESGSESGAADAAGPVMTYHGSDELVIPEELFGSVRLVRNPDDFAMVSDPGLDAVPYEDGVSEYSKAKKKK
ncbi:eCIS core domain-containing protein [Streptomyces sp. NPDC003299]